MKTLVEFRSAKFPPYDGEDELVNPGLWGKRLAEFFVAELPKYGFTVEEIIAEDWGWYVPIQNTGFRLAVCCGHQYGDDDEYQCFTDSQKPIIRKLFKKIDTTEQLVRRTAAMDSILSGDPKISDVSCSESN